MVKRRVMRAFGARNQPEDGRNHARLRRSIPAGSRPVVDQGERRPQSVSAFQGNAETLHLFVVTRFLHANRFTLRSETL